MTQWPYRQAPSGPFEVNWDSPQAEGLIDWLPMHGQYATSSSRVFNRVRGLNGTPQTGLSATDVAEYGPVIDFPGTETANDHLPLPLEFQLAGKAAFTISCRFRSDVAVAAGSTVDSYYYEGRPGTPNAARVFLQHNFNGDMFAVVTDDSATTHVIIVAHGNLDTSRVQHVALTYDSVLDEMFVYLDGDVLGSLSTAMDVVETGNTTNGPDIGRKREVGFTPFNTFDGAILDFRVHDRALPQSTIRQQINPETQWDLYRVPTPATWFTDEMIAQAFRDPPFSLPTFPEPEVVPYGFGD